MDDEMELSGVSRKRDAPRSILVSILVPLLVGLILNQPSGHLLAWLSSGSLETGSRSEPSRIKPNNLLSYTQFLAAYPRTKTSSNVEQSSRRLLFNADLVSVYRHNLDYLSGGMQTYLKRQSPFVSDRSPLEQLDVLGQLDSFDLTKIREHRVAAGGANRVSGIAKGPGLEKSNKLNIWWTRLVEGDSYFDIPNYPLSAQPDEDRITHIDADLRDCFGEIRDQKKCGACYAFSWTAYAEWHYCRQSGEKIDFSEQHIVDCGHLAKLNGCVDGALLDVRDFSHTFGFHLERDYPYQGKVRSCKRSSGSVAVKTMDFKRIIVDRQQWEEVLREQPIWLEVSLPRDILSYKRGVHPGNNCDRRIAHGMLLVGHGRDKGVPYWLLRNSMGTNWGENGYLRLSREAPMKDCFQTGFISRFKFRDLDEQNYYDFYERIQFEPTVQPEVRSVVNKKDLLNWILKNDNTSEG